MTASAWGLPRFGWTETDAQVMLGLSLTRPPSPGNLPNDLLIIARKTAARFMRSVPCRGKYLSIPDCHYSMTRLSHGIAGSKVIVVDVQRYYECSESPGSPAKAGVIIYTLPPGTCLDHLVVAAKIYKPYVYSQLRTTEDTDTRISEQLPSHFSETLEYRTRNIRHTPVSSGPRLLRLKPKYGQCPARQQRLLELTHPIKQIGNPQDKITMQQPLDLLLLIIPLS